jgi:hypothetical protein
MREFTTKNQNYVEIIKYYNQINFNISNSYNFTNLGKHLQELRLEKNDL